MRFLGNSEQAELHVQIREAMFAAPQTFDPEFGKEPGKLEPHVSEADDELFDGMRTYKISAECFQRFNSLSACSEHGAALVLAETVVLEEEWSTMRPVAEIGEFLRKSSEVDVSALDYVSNVTLHTHWRYTVNSWERRLHGNHEARISARSLPQIFSANLGSRKGVPAEERLRNANRTPNEEERFSQLLRGRRGALQMKELTSDYERINRILKNLGIVAMPDLEEPEDRAYGV